MACELHLNKTVTGKRKKINKKKEWKNQNTPWLELEKNATKALDFSFRLSRQP